MMVYAIEGHVLPGATPALRGVLTEPVDPLPDGYTVPPVALLARKHAACVFLSEQDVAGLLSLGADPTVSSRTVDFLRWLATPMRTPDAALGAFRDEQGLIVWHAGLTEIHEIKTLLFPLARDEAQRLVEARDPGATRAIFRMQRCAVGDQLHEVLDLLWQVDPERARRFARDFRIELREET